MARHTAMVTAMAMANMVPNSISVFFSTGSRSDVCSLFYMQVTTRIYSGSGFRYRPCLTLLRQDFCIE